MSLKSNLENNLIIINFVLIKLVKMDILQVVVVVGHLLAINEFIPYILRLIQLKIN